MAHCQNLQRQGRDVHSMFLHVPSFDQIPEEAQMEILVKVLNEVKAVVGNNEGNLC